MQTAAGQDRGRGRDICNKVPPTYLFLLDLNDLRLRTAIQILSQPSLLDLSCSERRVLTLGHGIEALLVMDGLSRGVIRRTACHLGEYVSLPPGLSFIGQAAPLVERVESKRWLQPTVLTVNVLDLKAVELGQVVQLQNVEDALQCPVE